MGLFRVFMVESSAVLISGWVGWDWDLCVGLFYEHRFAMLITNTNTNTNTSRNANTITNININTNTNTLA